MAAPDTRRKTCVLSDICVLCGFSFIEYEKKEKVSLLLISILTENSDLTMKGKKGKKTYIKLQGSTFRITVLHV